MIILLSKYFAMGLLVIFILDVINSLGGDEEQQFTNIDRLIMIMLWPISLLLFIISLIKYVLKK